jgi:ABC-2 type transport system permease protein
MTPFTAIVRTTVLQFMGRQRVIGFGLLSLMPAGLLAAAARAREVEGIDTDLGALLVTPFFAVVLPITALILASSALGDERRDKTLSFIVLRPIRRLEIAVAKTVAASAVSAGFAFLGAVALSLTYVAVGGRIDVLPSIVVGATLSCVLYSSVFVLIGNVASRPTLIGLLYVLFVENVLAAELPRLSGASPWRIGLGATIDLMPTTFPARTLLGALGELVPSLGNALIATGSTAVVAVGICAFLLMRMDSV